MTRWAYGRSSEAIAASMPSIQTHSPTGVVGIAEQLFNKGFELVRSEMMTDSLPLFRDMERWQEWLKMA
jgi:hypothetical protein